MWIDHCKEIRIRFDEGLTLETSASESLYGGEFTLSTQAIEPMVNYLVILPPTQHHSFFRNLPPLDSTLVHVSFLITFIAGDSTFTLVYSFFCSAFMNASFWCVGRKGFQRFARAVGGVWLFQILKLWKNQAKSTIKDNDDQNNFESCVKISKKPETAVI